MNNLANNPTSSVSNLLSFIDMKSPQFKDLYFLYLDLCVAELSPQETVTRLSESIRRSFNFPPSVSIKVAKIMFSIFTAPNFSSQFCDLTASSDTPSFAESSEEDSDTADSSTSPDFSKKLVLSTIDYQKFQELTSADPNISIPLKCLLLAFMSVYRYFFHRSGWVRYDRKLILFLAGLEDIPTKEIECFISYLHNEYGLEMCVVGSNSPIPCFKFDWMFSQTQPGSHLNPFLSFDDSSPATIKSIALGQKEPKSL